MVKAAFLYERKSKPKSRIRIRMNIHHQKHLKTWLVSTTLLVILAGGFVARTAFAKLAANTIDPIGIVAGKGRQVTVTGPIAVTTDERSSTTAE